VEAARTMSAALRQVADDLRREQLDELRSASASPAPAGEAAGGADTQAAQAAGAAAAEAPRARLEGPLPRAVRELDDALAAASPTKVAAVGDELPQVRARGPPRWRGVLAGHFG
jgi:hypothetical protein